MGSGTHPTLPYGTFVPSYVPGTLPCAFAAHFSPSSRSALWLCATCCSPPPPLPLAQAGVPGLGVPVGVATMLCDCTSSAWEGALCANNRDVVRTCGQSTTAAQAAAVVRLFYGHSTFFVPLRAGDGGGWGEEDTRTMRNRCRFCRNSIMFVSCIVVRCLDLSLFFLSSPVNRLF